MTATAPETLDLQRAAREHLWLHFTRMGGDGEVPIIVRGDGCYLEDSKGKRYLDALAGLFSVNIGYGYGEEIGEAAAAQMRELPFYTNWSYAHPRAIELASEVASLAPGDLNRLFFVSGGSEAVESAWKLARQYYSARGEMRTGRRRPCRSTKAIVDAPVEGDLPAHRLPRHDDGRPFDQRDPGDCAYRSSRSCPTYCTCGTRIGTTALPKRQRRSSPHFSSTISSNDRGGGSGDRGDGDHGARAKRGRLPSRRRRATGRGVREICDRYDILLCADEVITGFGRVGAWFGSERYDIRPDLMTIAKGLSSFLCRDRRGRRQRPRDGAVHARHEHVLARHHLRRSPRHVGDRAQEHRDHEAGQDRRARRGTRTRSARHSSSCSSSRSSATSAEPASSMRSSSSRTRRRGSHSTTGNARRSCVTSSRRASSSAG